MGGYTGNHMGGMCMQEEEGIEREKGKEPETWRGGRGKAEGGEQKRNRHLVWEGISRWQREQRAGERQKDRHKVRKNGTSKHTMMMNCPPHPSPPPGPTAPLTTPTKGLFLIASTFVLMLPWEWIPNVLYTNRQTHKKPNCV